MWELCRIVSIVLVEWVTSEASSTSVCPRLQTQIAHWTSTIEVRNLHGPFIGFIVDDFGTKHMLLLLAKSFQNVIGADLHDRKLSAHALLLRLSLSCSTLLILLDFTIATLWHILGNKNHKFGLFHVWLAWTTLLCSPSSVLAVWHPIVMGLIVFMILVKWVIQVTIQPDELWNNTEVERHLRVFVGLVVVPGSDWVDFLINIRVDDLVSPVVVGLLVIVLWEVRRVEIFYHIYYYKAFTPDLY